MNKVTQKIMVGIIGAAAAATVFAPGASALTAGSAQEAANYAVTRADQNFHDSIRLANQDVDTVIAKHRANVDASRNAIAEDYNNGVAAFHGTVNDVRNNAYNTVNSINNAVQAGNIAKDRVAGNVQQFRSDAQYVANTAQQRVQGAVDNFHNDVAFYQNALHK